MNIEDYHYRSLYGRSKKRTFNLSLSMFDYVLDKKFKLGGEQINASIPVASDFRDGYLVVAEDDGHLDLINCERMYTLRRFKAHNNSIFDVKFRPNQNKHVLTTSGDRSIGFWDLENEIFLERIYCGHNCSIKTVDFYDSNIFVSGGRDGFIRLWDLRVDKKVVQSIQDAHRNNLKSTKKQCRRQANLKKVQVSDPNSVVASVLFGSHNYLYSSGANDGCIKIWDLRNLNSNSFNQLIYLQKLDYCGQNEKAEGFTSLALDSRHQLFASCTDNKIYSYDYKGSVGIKQESEYVKSFKGASVTNYTRINILNDDLLLSGSSQAEVCIWSLNKSRKNYQNYPALRLPHGIEEVSVITSNSSNYEIYTCDDTTNMYKWKINSKLNNQNYKEGEVSVEWDNQIVDEKIELGKQRKVLSPKNTVLNLSNLSSGLKRSYSMMKAQ